MNIKKYLLSSAFIILFAGHAFSRYATITALTNVIANASMPAQQVVDTADTGSAPQSASPPQLQARYVDGSYTGKAETGYYGTVQVQVLISGGQLVDVQFLQYPNARSTSRFINQHAIPILWQEAIQAQSAKVDVISGATDTSASFQQSLASALSQAENYQ